MKWMPNCRNTGMSKMVIRGRLCYAHWPQQGSQIHCPIRNQIWGPLRQTSFCPKQYQNRDPLGQDDVFPNGPQIPCCIHSFIHYGDLYSAPSRLLLRSAPDPCTAKKKSFETRVECVRKNPGEQSL